MTQVGTDPMTARVALTSVAWGTKLDLTCSYPRGTVDYEGGAYALVVHTKDGRTQRVATWNGLPGKAMHGQRGDGRLEERHPLGRGDQARRRPGRPAHAVTALVASQPACTHDGPWPGGSRSVGRASGVRLSRRRCCARARAPERSSRETA